VTGCDVVRGLNNHGFTEQQPEKADKAMTKVPCNGCTLCCRKDAIRLLPEDDASQYQTEPHQSGDGSLMLAHRPDGSCIYLTKEGCGIHGRAPKMCRQFDCRDLASKLTFTQARKLADKKMLPIAIWRKGKDLIKVIENE